MFNELDHIVGAITVRQRRFFLNLLRKPDVSEINEYTCVGGVTNIKYLADNKINSILDLRAEDSDDQNLIKKYSINYLRIKIMDRNVPDIKDATLAINWLNKQISNKKKVFIHCNLGRGRAPLMVCLFLISRGMNTDQAINTVKNRRVHAYFNKKQLQYIHNFKNHEN